MKFKRILLLFLVCVAHQVKAQDLDVTPWLFEAGASIGAMNALPDVGGRIGKGTRGVKDFNIKNTHLCGSIYLAAGYQNALIIRLEGTFGQVSAYDSILENVKKTAIGRYNRNLQFRSYISEVALVAEFHPADIFGLSDEGSFFASLSPYFMGGIGYYHFNPQTMLNSKWVDLQPLRTEGQGFDEYPERKNYKLYQFNFPAGVGFRYELTGNLNLRLESLFRISRTDYLDDVSTRYIDPALFSKYLSGTTLAQALILNNRVRPGTIPNETTARPGGVRGHTTNNDHYFTVNLKIGYVFGMSKGSEKSTDQQCPAVF